MFVLSIAVALAIGPARFYTPSGAVELQPTTSQMAFEVGNSATLDAIMRKHPEAQTTYMFGKYYLLTGAQQSLARELVQNGAASRMLAAYETVAHHAVLFADGRIRARFPANVDGAEIARRAKRAGAERVSLSRADYNLWDIYVAKAADTVGVAARLHESHMAMWAEPDFISRHKLEMVPNDPLYDDQWHLDLIGATGAWDISTGSQDIIIAIIDSGTDMSHPEFEGKLVSPKDTLNGDDDPSPTTDDDAHGTSTAGLAAAIGNNELGVIGVCPQCKIMPVRMLGGTGFGRESADSDAFYWSADHGAQVLSNSWGPASAVPVTHDFELALQHAADGVRDGKGAVILFAAGNDYRENESYEVASHPLVLGVSATNYFEKKEDYSDWGNEVDIAAPAASVSADITGSDGYDDGDYTFSFGGTSAATPVVAGVAGLILSVAPDLTRGQVQSIITGTADQIGGVTYTDGFHPYYGHGRVNALRALQSATGGDVCQPLVEDCHNGVDDDCDAMADDADTSCAPLVTLIGTACNQNFQCGPDATCLIEDEGYPGGYCSPGCPCADDNVCVSDRFGDYCLDACASVADCREGYDCLVVDADSHTACLPSCKFLGCTGGETCDEASGTCFHNGPVAPGGACDSSVDCAEDGRCLSEDRFGTPDGFCSVRCESDGDCDEGTACVSLGWFSVCMPDCQRVTDCRDGYSCWPSEDGTTGTCWIACASDDDCSDDEHNGVCNSWGLCDDEQPPVTTPADGGGDLPEACLCDATTACDAHCDCDPECQGTLKDKSGCAAAPPEALYGVLLALGALARRRRAK